MAPMGGRGREGTHYGIILLNYNSVSPFMVQFLRPITEESFIYSNIYILRFFTSMQQSYVSFSGGVSLCTRALRARSSRYYVHGSRVRLWSPGVV